MADRLLSTAKLLLPVLLTGWLLTEVGGFERRQAFLLAFLVVLAGIWLRVLTKVADTRPYALVITVNHEAIRAALGLTSTGLRTGDYAEFVFTNNGLIIRVDTEKCQFLSNCVLVSDLETNERVRTNMFSGPTGWPPIRFRSFGGGFRLEVQLDDTWWDAHQAQADSDLPRKLAYDDGSLLLAEMPPGYFPEHIREWYEPVKWFSTYDRRRKRWGQRLQSVGWTVDENSPEEVSHRFATISYRPMQPC